MHCTSVQTLNIGPFYFQGEVFNTHFYGTFKHKQASLGKRVTSLAQFEVYAHVIYMHMFLLIAGMKRVVRTVSFTPVQFSHPVDPSTWFSGRGHNFAAAESNTCILVSKVGVDLQLCCRIFLNPLWVSTHWYNRTAYKIMFLSLSKSEQQWLLPL